VEAEVVLILALTVSLVAQVAVVLGTLAQLVLELLIKDLQAELILIPVVVVKAQEAVVALDLQEAQLQQSSVQWVVQE
jgi:hypothetical protein